MFERSEFEKFSVLYGPKWDLEASFLVLFVGTKSTNLFAFLFTFSQKSKKSIF